MGRTRRRRDGHTNCSPVFLHFRTEDERWESREERETDFRLQPVRHADITFLRATRARASTVEFILITADESCQSLREQARWQEDGLSVFWPSICISINRERETARCYWQTGKLLVRAFWLMKKRRVLYIYTRRRLKSSVNSERVYVDFTGRTWRRLRRTFLP